MVQGPLARNPPAGQVEAGNRAYDRAGRRSQRLARRRENQENRKSKRTHSSHPQSSTFHGRAEASLRPPATSFKPIRRAWRKAHISKLFFAMPGSRGIILDVCLAAKGRKFKLEQALEHIHKLLNGLEKVRVVAFAGFFPRLNLMDMLLADSNASVREYALSTYPKMPNRRRNKA
jgi:hypothetical protein